MNKFLKHLADLQQYFFFTLLIICLFQFVNRSSEFTSLSVINVTLIPAKKLFARGANSVKLVNMIKWNVTEGERCETKLLK